MYIYIAVLSRFLGTFRPLSKFIQSLFLSPAMSYQFYIWSRIRISFKNSNILLGAKLLPSSIISRNKLKTILLKLSFFSAIHTTVFPKNLRQLKRRYHAQHSIHQMDQLPEQSKLNFPQILPPQTICFTSTSN